MINTIERVNTKGPQLGPRLARFFGLMGAVGILAASPSCSFIVDSNANQCEQDSDCLARGDGSTKCSTEKLCVSGSSAECTKNADCVNGTESRICVKATGKCVALKSEECQTVDGDPTKDDAFIIGSVLPTTGGDDIFGKPVENAILLALDGVKNQSLGVPTSMPGVYQSILYVGCNDNTNGEDTTVKAAKHLAEELHVSAIIGEAFSGATLSIANEVTIKDGTLLISPAATSDSITSLIDNNLVWRTSPPDTLQAAALKLYIPVVEDKVRKLFGANGKDPMSSVKIAILHNKDPYGQGLAAGLLATPVLKINNNPVNEPVNANFYKNVEYDETNTDSQLAAAKDLSDNFHPNIIVMLGFNEVPPMMTTIESKWIMGGGDPKELPLYVFPDGVPGSDLYSAVDKDPALRVRVSGTIPGVGAGNAAFTTFVDLYNTKFGNEKDIYPADTFGAAGGYDATFLLIYAATTLGGKPETGKDLATGMMKLSDPMAMMTIDAGSGNLSAGFQELLKKGALNYNGASGPLDFDPDTGEARSDILIWCVNNTGTTTNIKNTGLFFSAAKNALDGVLNDAACQ